VILKYLYLLIIYSATYDNSIYCYELFLTDNENLFIIYLFSLPSAFEVYTKYNAAFKIIRFFMLSPNRYIPIRLWCLSF
jgi:hypothetical protein